jgi:hypothetical protein
VKKTIIGLVGATLFAGGALGREADAGGALNLELTRQTTEWTFLHQGRKALVYCFAPGKSKPYVKELYTFQGHNILRDAPHDHLHHHGLMYGIVVNGLNFWEEVSGNGIQKVVETREPVLDSLLPRATFTQVLHWVAPPDAFLPDTAPVALLIERRTLKLALDPALQEVALEWESEFEVGGKTNTVTLTGTRYDGLGLRFQEELDPLAEHSLAGTPPNLAGGRQDVAAAPWASVSFDAPGWAATVAMAGHPSNVRGDAVFFSMLKPFAYLSATQGLDREPLVYHAGDKFQLRYLILLYGEAHPSETLRQHVEKWRKE